MKIPSKSIVLAILSLLILIAAANPSYTEELDWVKMQKDLRILEGVLGNLLIQDHVDKTSQYRDYSMVVGRNPNPKGIYVQGYGAIFAVRGIHSSAKLKRKSDFTGSIPKNPSAKSKKEFEVELDDASSNHQVLKTQIAEFFIGYANAISQLKEKDRVTVLVTPHSSTSASGYTPFVSYRQLDPHSALSPDVRVRVEKHIKDGKNSDFESGVIDRIKEADHTIARVFQHGRQDSLLRGTVTVRDLIAFRKGKIGDQDLRNRISFQLEDRKSEVQKRIDIMSGIIDAATGKDQTAGIFPNMGTQTMGIYQESLGAIFLVERSGRGDLISHLVNRDDTSDLDETMRDILIETVADYGHTLQGLKPDDRIFVRVNISPPRVAFRMARFDDASHKNLIPFTLSITMKDVDAYHDGKATMDALRKRVQITDFGS